VLTGPRLRQVALVAHDCGQVSDELRAAFGWGEPFHDPGVGRFGLTNAVFAAGDTFVEVVAPVQAGTTAGRYLERRGGDGGYMAIFQVPDLAAARARLPGLGVRVVWTADLPDIAGTHLHPKDVPGAVLTTAFAKVAFAGDYGGTWFLTQLVGPAVAKELYYFSDRLTAEDARQLGIVNGIFPAEDFEREVMARARRLAKGPSIAYRYMKENLNRAVTGDLGDCMDLEVTHHTHTAFTEDHREAARAFVDKREPQFRGR
jgi:hypothetical protein